MDKRFLGILAALVIIFVGIFALTQHSSQKKVAPPLGVKHPSQGGTHIARGQSHSKYNSDPPSSGWHYSDAGAPTLWGVYTQEVPDEVFLHNEEHGGVIIAYKPDLPNDQIKKLQDLFSSPYSDPNFKPNKAVVTPRSKNTKPIEMAAWTYTLSLDSYNKTTIENFYLQHVGHGTEPGAGPFNPPINQAKQ